MAQGAKQSRVNPTAACLVMLAGLTLVTFYPVLRGQFLNWDDQVNIVTNPDLNPVTVEGLLRNFSHTRLTLYMPLAYVVWGGLAVVARQAPDAAAVTLNPAVFHGFNLIIHTLTVFAVFFVLRALRHTRAAAMVGAAVFAVHPIQVEAVAWVSGMYTVLGTLLCFAALLQYLKYSEHCKLVEGGTPAVPSDVERAASSPWFHYALATVLYVVALFTKPASVAVVPLAGAMDVLLLRRRVGRVVLSLLPWALAGLVIARVASRFQDIHFQYPPVWKRPVISLDALTAYLRILVYPVHLAPDRGRPPDVVMHSPERFYTWIAAAAVIVVGVLAWRRAPRLAAAVAVMVAGVLPYLGLVPFDFQPHSTVAERYFYTAMLGVAMVVSLAIDRLVVMRPALLAFCGVLIVGLAVRSNLQSRYWRDTDTLFNHTLAVYPRSPLAHNILGYLAKQRGDYDEALRHYAAVLEMRPLDPQANFNAGNIFLTHGRPDEALRFYRSAVREAPDNPDQGPAYRTNLGIALVQTGRVDEGMYWFEKALELNPTDPLALANIAKIHLDRGDARLAVHYYELALKSAPDFAVARRGLELATERVRASSTGPAR